MTSDISEFLRFHWWCRRQHYFCLRMEKLIINMLSLLMMSVDAVTGNVVSNPLIVAVLGVGATIVKRFAEYRRYDTQIDISCWAYTSYAKNPKHDGSATADCLDAKFTTTQHNIIDLAPVFPDSIKQRYRYKGTQDWADGAYKRERSMG